VAPDPATAELLKKHASGEKLTPQDYGKLGAWKAKLKNVFAGKSAVAAPGAAVTAVSAAPLAPLAPGQAPIGGPGVAPADPDLVRRTTAAILQTCDGVACTWIVAEARKAGADELTARAFEKAAALQPGPRDLMVQTSPELLTALGVHANNYPVTAFLTGMGVWAGSLMVAVNKLKAMQEERKEKRSPQKAEQPGTSFSGQPIPSPRENPPGAPPTIT